MKTPFKYIYGPVPSWRLGSSLGVDLFSQEEKICDFDCVYCQLGPTKRYTRDRKKYVAIEDVIDELGELPGTEIDFITFSGRGEPTLAANLGEGIRAVKFIRKEPVAVLTNASLMRSEEARMNLSPADLVVAKIDAYSPASLRDINRPAEGIEFGDIPEGIKAFKKSFKGKLALQMMFIDSNKDGVDKMIGLAVDIDPDEIQINTPLRPCPVWPLAREEILRIAERFAAVCGRARVVSVYDKRVTKHVVSLSDEDTLKRRGKIG
ncbi:MAG: radical SAM protein [Candidatus Omnitrophica bacterium]|nr:radical SAM protein [Candidatus Omnitrophota bacterium]